MDWIALLKTLGLCLISIIIELISYSKEGTTWFENLRQPKYSFPFFVWYHSQKDVTGQIYPTYDDESRQWGLLIFILSALAFFLNLAFGATNSFDY